MQQALYLFKQYRTKDVCAAYRICGDRCHSIRITHLPNRSIVRQEVIRDPDRIQQIIGHPLSVVTTAEQFEEMMQEVRELLEA